MYNISTSFNAEKLNRQLQQQQNITPSAIGDARHGQGT